MASMVFAAPPSLSTLRDQQLRSAEATEKCVYAGFARGDRCWSERPAGTAQGCWSSKSSGSAG